MNRALRTLRTAAASLTVTALALATLVGGVAAGTTAAHAAASSDIDLQAATSLTITKLEQPRVLGQPADGLPLANLTGQTPIPGVTFTVTPVPLDQPMNTAAGWQQATAMTVAEAYARTDASTPAATGTTDASGTLTFSQLGVGLFLVAETDTPAGVIASAPALIALPVIHPTPGIGAGTGSAAGVDAWLYDVHVYPKNARVSVQLDVIDRDAVTVDGPVGALETAAETNTVTWTAHADIPRNGIAGERDTLDGYEVVNVIDPSLRLVTGVTGADGVSVRLTGTSGVTLTPEDYVLTVPNGAGGEVVVTMRASGLAKLAQAKAEDDSSQVRLEYVTQVLTEGEHENVVYLCASAACIAGSGDTGSAVSPDAVSDAAVTKWGPLNILVHEVDRPETRIPGAKFMLYLSEADARAGRNPVSAAGATEWASDAQGRLTVAGLRFSNYVDGKPRTEDDPLYRHYWVVLSHVPAGWQGSSDPIPLSVTTASATEAELAIFELFREGSGAAGGSGGGGAGSDGGLASTGAGFAAGATVAGLALLLGGFAALAFVRRRRDAAETR